MKEGVLQATDTELAVRTYRPGDEDAIQELYAAVFGRPRSLDEWRWRFLGSPSGPADMFLVEDADRVVGHLGQAPMPTWVDGRRLLLGQGGDTMVLPSHRGRGAMRMLVEASLADHPYDILLRFPSEMARPRFVRYGAGVEVGTLPLWVRRNTLTRPVPAPLRPLARGVLAAARFAADLPRPGMRVEPLQELGPEVDALADGSKVFARCIRVRDATYLRWRWLEQPHTTWHIRGARGADERLRGFSVLGLEEGERGTLVGWINDLLAPDAVTLRALLVDAARELVERGAASVYCYYLDPRPWAKRVLVRSGFLRSGGHRFLARPSSSEAGDEVSRLDSWYLTRSDTEPWPNLVDA
jgi:hypothetical protein